MSISGMAKRLIGIASAAAVAVSVPVHTSAEEPSVVFFDDFSSGSLDTESWLIAEKNWGGTVTENGVKTDYNGGVIAENVRTENGSLILTGLGNGYEGDIRGINRDGTRREDGKRCGGAIATKDYYGSGSYEIRARIAPEYGCCSAMWTFEYEEDYSGDELSIVNHEIDIEFPGRDDSGKPDLSHALCNTWVTEEDYTSESVYCGDQTDGKFHTYRFDWHTGGDGEVPRVEFYFDGELAYTSYEDIPTNESRFWIGLWFPKNWAGTPDFEQTEFEVDWVRITPFHESGDTPQHESYPDSGWGSREAALPEGWLMWHSYTSYSAGDSRLYLRSPGGDTEEISGSFRNAMNGSFGASPDQITFMAIDPEADEWDIFLREDGVIRNLTERSGYRSEDPKFSPDGSSIVFKRGHWDNERDDFVYDLALLDTASGEVTMLTDTGGEEAMPCFSADGRYIYYAYYPEGSGGIGRICRLDVSSLTSETIFSEEGVNAYYPAVYGDTLYFTKWYSAEQHYDQLVKWDGKELTVLPFVTDKADFSDACPVDEGVMIFSSTTDGPYDLYISSGSGISPVPELNDRGRNELGAAFFPCAAATVPGDVDADGILSAADLVLFGKWLLGMPGAELRQPDAADLCRDGILDTFDMCIMRNKAASA